MRIWWRRERENSSIRRSSVSLSVAVLCSALVFGLTLCHVLQAPGSLALDRASWLLVQQTFHGGFAIVGGVAEIVGVLAAAVLAIGLRRSRPSQARAGAVAAVALAGTIAAFVVGNLPVNTLVAGASAATLPADWPQLRVQWEIAHAASAALSAVAFVVLLAALIWSRTPHPSSAAVSRDRSGN